MFIWDNCSNDGTYDWLEEYAKSDPRITKVFGCDQNLGVEAINTMAEQATSKYILKVDDDVVVPASFVERLLRAYEAVGDNRLLFLGWDMAWHTKTFATRSGMWLYSRQQGKIVDVPGGKVLITFDPEKWMVNGVCRLSTRDDFLKIGGHPKGIKYGVDSIVSKHAAKAGYWIGYYQSNDNSVILHCGNRDSMEYRAMKNKELHKTRSPLHV